MIQEDGNERRPKQWSRAHRDRENVMPEPSWPSGPDRVGGCF